MTRAEQYIDNLLERLRTWRMANVDGGIKQARKELRAMLTQGDVDHLFDNWLNANFERIELRKVGENSHTAIIVPHRIKIHRSADETIRLRRTRDSIANRLATSVKSNLYEEFAARIWDTVLPNGVVLRDATGKDLRDAGGWYIALANKIKPTQKLEKHITTKQLFDLSQRFHSHAA